MVPSVSESHFRVGPRMVWRRRRGIGGGKVGEGGNRVVSRAHSLSVNHSFP